MSYNLLILIILVMFIILIGSSLWIGIALGLAGVMMFLLFTDFPLQSMVASTIFHINSTFVLTCLPLFVLMGELILRSGIGYQLYSGLTPWLTRIPGKLLHTNIVGCTIFAAASGSSAVTAAAVGATTIPELKSRNYDRGIVIGSLAGAGTLGLLIPPSLPMIVYGGVTSESIGQLFLGGIFPGLLLSSLFMSFVAIRSVLSPSLVPTTEEQYSWKDRLKGLKKILPVGFLVLWVLGSIYFGIATPTEAGAMGAIGALILALLYRNLNWKGLEKALLSTVQVTAMAMLIISGASLLSMSVGYLGIPQELATAISAANLSKYLVFTIVCIIYLILGCVFEGLSMMMLTLPVIYPLMLGLGFDGVWFGIILVLLIEAGQITPPIGFNLFILRNLTGEKIEMIAKNSMPFFLIILLVLTLVTLFPDIALFLPTQMIRG